MRSIFRVAAVLAAATIPVVGLSATQASAKPKPKATPQILIRCSPNPVVETSTSNVVVICQVESNPSNGGSVITISSTQMAARCPGGAFFYTNLAPVPGATISINLDNDGNATVVLDGINCAPGTALVTADLDSPPYSTAITKLVMEPPQVTPPGVKGFPNPEVEVGDGGTVSASATGAQSASEADFVFYVETNPVYAEQTVTLTSDQLTARCGTGGGYLSSAFAILGNFPPGGGQTGVVATEAGGIDNDGNAVFVFTGGSCAAGKSTVIADVQNGGPTYSTQVNILSPAVTI